MENPVESLNRAIKALCNTAKAQQGDFPPGPRTKADGFAEAAKPLMDYLRDNCHPHMRVIVDSENAELLEGQKMCARGTFE